MLRKYTGNVLFNVFDGDDKRPAMTRAITEIQGQEYAFYLNEFDGGVIIAVHHVEGRNGQSPIINRNAIAQEVVTEIEGLDGYEYIFDLEFDDVLMQDFVVSVQRENKNGTPFKLAQPKKIALVRANAKEATPPAEATGTDGI